MNDTTCRLQRLHGAGKTIPAEISAGQIPGDSGEARVSGGADPERDNMAKDRVSGRSRIP
jgi:hypothetical protein